MLVKKHTPQCTYSNSPISLCLYSYKFSLCVGVTVLPNLVTYPTAMPEVLLETSFGGAVSSDLGPAAMLSFCGVCVRLIGVGLVVC